MAYFAVLVPTLALAALVALAGALLLAVALSSAGGRARLRDFLGGQERHPIGWAWGVAAAATAGSLYLSEGVGFVPCVLCWYQRIAMYPLVLVLGVAWIRADTGVWRYVLPVAAVGLAMASYHRVLQERPTLDLLPCGVGPPCSGRYLNVFGFVTIPTMAGAAFLLLVVLMLTLRLLEQDRTAERPAEEPAGALEG